MIPCVPGTITFDHDSGGEPTGGGAAATCAFPSGSTPGNFAAPRRSARLGSIHAECKTIASVTASAAGSQAQAQWKNVASGLSGIVFGCQVLS